jgi:hypothetical protein
MLLKSPVATSSGSKRYHFCMRPFFPAWLWGMPLLACPLVSLAVDPSNPAEAAKNAPAAKTVKPIAAPDETTLRSTITRSLGFLAKEGDQWMADKNCNACHHMPELLWSHREAARRGFDIDQKKFDEWLAWSVERATDKKPGLEEASLMILAMPERPAPDLIQLLVAGQKPDGTWDPAGQFASMQKRGGADARANSTRLNLLALASARPEPSESSAARSKAAAALHKKDTPTATESLVYRTLEARHFGNENYAAKLCETMVKQQRGDGGWSSYIGENQSDSLATGQVLYALQHFSSDAKTAPAIARAQHWLIKTQRDDGSWTIDINHISKTDRSAPEKAKSFQDATGIYTYWGTAWATLGLLQGVPAKAP